MSKILLFNKPYNVLSQFRDPQGRATLANFIQDPSLRLAGRLDRDSEGLLILSDNGALIHKITQPDKQMSKSYWIQVEGEPSDEHLTPIRDGLLELKDGLCKPAKITAINEPPNLWPRNPPIRVRASIPTAWLQITLTEGRNRQVRRMMAAVGYPVLRLIRHRVGSWTIHGLQPGEHQFVS